MEFSARAERNRRQGIVPVVPIALEALPANKHAASCGESYSDSPVEQQKVTMGFLGNFQTASDYSVNNFQTANDYSVDSRKSNASPVLRRPSTAKAFNFGSPPANQSDDEEDIIDATVYRSLCLKKLAEAVVQVPDKKVHRRFSQLGRHSLSTSPASPLSPQLKSVSMRPMPPVPMMPVLTDSMRASSVESIQTKIFQPSPLPGRVLENCSDQPIASNSDSFMALAERVVPAVSISALSESLQNASEQLSCIQSQNISKNSSPAKSNHDWLRNYKCSMRKCVSPITEGWKRPDGGSVQSGRMMAIFETGFYIVGMNLKS